MNARVLVLVGTFAVVLLAGCTGTTPTDSVGPVETPDPVAPAETATGPGDQPSETTDGSTPAPGETPGSTGDAASGDADDPGSSRTPDETAESGNDGETPTTTGVETVATGDRTTTEQSATEETTTGVERTNAGTSTRTPIYRTGGPCTDAWVSFWGLPAAEFWDRDRVRVGVRIGGNASVLLVVEANDSVVGVEAFSSPESGLTARGYVLELDEPLAGTTSLSVTVYADRDRDGEYDPEVDRPCYDGGVVRDGPTTIDAEAIGDGTDAT